MEEQDRQEMIRHQKEKSRHLLSQAEEMLHLQHWDLAVNRFYYACFHMLQALFISNKLSAHTHTGSATVFGQFFVKKGLVDAAYGRFFSQMVQLRQKADYNSIADITEMEARDIVDKSVDFVNTVESMIEP